MLPTNDRGAVDVTLPHKLAILSITPDASAESGYAFTLLENIGNVTLEDLDFFIRRAYEMYLDRLRLPGYEPSPLFAFAQELEKQIEGAQITSMPAFPDEPDNVVY